MSESNCCYIKGKEWILLYSFSGFKKIAKKQQHCLTKLKFDKSQSQCINKYSRVPNKRGVSNKRLRWKISANLISVQDLINVQGGYLK